VIDMGVSIEFPSVVELPPLVSADVRVIPVSARLVGERRVSITSWRELRRVVRRVRGSR
jgi:hypothetical protein